MNSRHVSRMSLYSSHAIQFFVTKDSAFSAILLGKGYYLSVDSIQKGIPFLSKLVYKK